MKILVRLSFILFLLMGLAGGWSAYRFLSQPAGDGSRVLVFLAEPGMGLYRAAAALEEGGILSNARYFRWMSRAVKKENQLKVGEYELNDGMRPFEILEILTSGKSKEYLFTVPEGFNIFEMASLVEERGLGSREKFLKLCRDPIFIRELLGESRASLEGYLFPESYAVTKFTGEREMIRLMVEKFKAEWESLWPKNQTRLNPYQVLILASVIEKETGAPFERPRISSVFHNRLAKRMKLQSDPTIIYSIAVDTGQITKNIKKSDILRPSPLNTYFTPGLPAGPVANPGRDSILAAMKPIPSRDLYFVSRNDGTHVFSETLKQHNEAVRDFQQKAAARKGKSWRDLNKKLNP